MAFGFDKWWYEALWKTILQQGCYVLWSDMPGWSSSTCSPFPHLPPPPKGHWPSAMEVNKHSYFQSFTWQGQIPFCAAVALQTGPWTAPVTQELITNVYWDHSQAHWTRNCGLMPRNLSFNHWFWWLSELRATGAVTRMKCLVIIETFATAQTLNDSQRRCVEGLSSALSAIRRWWRP